jgi:hypothetical protein
LVRRTGGAASPVVSAVGGLVACPDRRDDAWVVHAAPAVPALANGRFLALAALVSWLVTEALGAWMLSRWIARGGAHQAHGRPNEVPPAVLAGHAGLAFAGFCCWLGFVITGSAALAWLALGLLGPAIGLGVSTVTIWTPYPTRPSVSELVPPVRTRRSPRSPGAEELSNALSDEASTSRLVDELLASMLASRRSAADRKARLAPVIPVAHGVAAVVTFLFVMLAAIAAILGYPQNSSM